MLFSDIGGAITLRQRSNGMVITTQSSCHKAFITTWEEPNRDAIKPKTHRLWKNIEWEYCKTHVYCADWQHIARKLAKFAYFGRQVFCFQIRELYEGLCHAFSSDLCFPNCELCLVYCSVSTGEVNPWNDMNLESSIKTFEVQLTLNKYRC